MAKAKDGILTEEHAEEAAANGQKPKRTPRPMNPVIQTLARMDRLMAEHSPEERKRIVAWLSAAHAVDPATAAPPPAKE